MFGYDKTKSIKPHKFSINIEKIDLSEIVPKAGGACCVVNGSDIKEGALKEDGLEEFWEVTGFDKRNCKDVEEIKEGVYVKTFDIQETGVYLKKHVDGVGGGKVVSSPR